MHFDFDLKIDKMASLSKADFTVAEKDWLLNEAQNVLVKTRYSGNNSSTTAFESTQKRIDDLSALSIKYPDQLELTPTLLSGNIYELNLASLEHPYWFFTRGQVWVNLPNSCTKLAVMKLIQQDDLNYILEDPFNSSNPSEIIFNFGRASVPTGTYTKSSIYLYPGTYTLGNVRLEYIRQPLRMNYGGYVYIDGITYSQQNCELPDHTHSELVDLAVQIAAGIIESPEYVQVKTQKLFSNE